MMRRLLLMKFKNGLNQCKRGMGGDVEERKGGLHISCVKSSFNEWRQTWADESKGRGRFTENDGFLKRRESRTRRHRGTRASHHEPRPKRVVIPQNVLEKCLRMDVKRCDAWMILRITLNVGL